MTTSLGFLRARWQVAVAAMFVISLAADASDLATRSGDSYVGVRIIQVTNDKVVGEHQGKLITLRFQELTESSKSAVAAAISTGSEKATENSERSNKHEPAQAVDVVTLASPTQLELPAIKITGSFQVSRQPLALERATQSVGDQIDAKREAEKNASPLDPFWKARFWKYIPIAPTGLQRGVDDPFFTPAYLTVPGRQLEHQMAVSEKRAVFEFGRR